MALGKVSARVTKCFTKVKVPKLKTTNSNDLNDWTPAKITAKTSRNRCGLCAAADNYTRTSDSVYSIIFRDNLILTNIG